MNLQIVPIGHGSKLSDRSKLDLLKAVKNMEKEIEALANEGTYSNEARRVIIQEQLYGLKLGIILTGNSLIYK